MQKGGKGVQIACTIACVLNERPLIDYELCIRIYYINLNSENTYRCITNRLPVLVRKSGVSHERLV